LFSSSRALSFRFLLSAGLGLFGFGLVGISTAIDLLDNERAHRALILQRALGLAQLVAQTNAVEAPAVERELEVTLLRVRSVPHLRRAFLCDAAGRILYSAQSELRGRRAGEVDPMFDTILARGVKEGAPRHAYTPDGRRLLLVHPVVRPAAAPVADQLWLGTESDVAAQREPTRAALRRRTLVLAGLVLAGVIALWFVFDRVLTRRLGELLATTRLIAAGRRDVTAPTRGLDELARLGRSFNEMAGNLRAHEAALRTSEARLSDALAGSELGAWELPADDGRRLASAAAWQMLGIDRRATPAEPGEWEARVQPDDFARVMAELARLRDGHTVAYEAEYRIRHQDGSWRWFADKGRRLAAPVSGSSQRAAGTTRDITLSKQAELVQTAQREVLEDIALGRPLASTLEAVCRMAEANIEGVVCSILLLDSTGRHLRHGAAPSLSKVYCDALDGLAVGPEMGSCGAAAFTRQVVITEDIQSDPKWREFRVLAATHRLRACWSTPIISAGDKVLGTVALYFREVFRPRPEQERIVAIATQTAAVAIQRERLEAARHESEGRFRQLVEAIPDAIFFKDGAGRWLVVNQTAHGLFRLQGSEWREKTGAELALLRPEMAAAHAACIASDEATWQAGHLVVGEEQVELPDGTAAIFETRKVPQFLPDGSRAGLVIIGRDITARRHNAEQLRLAEERFGKAFRASPVAIFFSTLREGRILDVNESFVRLFGCANREAAIGRTSLELGLWVEDGDRSQIATELARSGSLRDRECRFRRRSGETGIGLASLETVSLHGEACVLGFLHDITERHHAEAFRETLLALEEQLSNAQSPLDAGRIIFAAADRLWRWDAGYLEVYDAENDLFRTVVDIDTVDGVRREVPMLSAVTPPTIRRRKILSAGGELLLRRPPIPSSPEMPLFGDTSRPSASLMVVPVRWKSQPVGILSVQSYALDAFSPQDLHTLQGLADHCGGAIDRLRAAAELRRSEARLTEIFSRLDDAVFVLNVREDGSLAFDSLNPRCEQALGVAPAAALGRTPQEILGAERAAELVPQLLACLKSGALVRFEPDAGALVRRSWSTTIVPIRDETDRIYRIAGIARDMTQRREMEDRLRQAQKMEAIGRLAGGIAHDFNNMLTVIILQAQLAREEAGVPRSVIDSLGEILQTANRSAALTRQLLLFSRRQVMQIQRHDLNALVTGMSRMLRRILGEDIILNLRQGAGELPVDVDGGMIDQIILNLAVNSRDAMPRGGTLTIATAQRAPASGDPAHAAAGWAVLQVLDSGSGIPPEVLPHIFEPFFTTKETGEGTGLGLATVFGIVEQHQGRIEVHSPPGQGAAFEILLPLGVVGKAPDPVAPAGPDRSRGSETILLVEDETAIRFTVRRVLTQHGYTVLEAPDAPAALRLWEKEQHRIDLLFTDIVMPGGVNGRELAAQLVAVRPSLRVIFTTGYSEAEAGRGFDLQPGQVLIAKPFGPDELLRLVHQMLHG
jgi:PAS domain S-box-containing protein